MTSDLPPDPFEEGVEEFDDACTAVGAAVLEAFAEGATLVTVTWDGGTGWTIDGDEP